MALSGSSSAFYTGTSNLSTIFAPTGKVTIHCWVNCSAVPSTATIKTPWCHRSVSGSDPHNAFHWNHTSGSFYKSVSQKSSGTYYPAQISATPAINTWHAVTSVYDGTNLKCWLNGSVDGTAACGASSTTAGPFSLLAAIDGSGNLDTGCAVLDIGQIAEVAIWTNALDASEVASLAKGFRPPHIRPQALVNYWPCLRELIEPRSSNTLVKKQGTTVVTNHPRMIG